MVPADSSSPILRPRAARDDEDIVAIYTRQEADRAPLTVAQYREKQDENAAASQAEQWVAVDEDNVLGFGGFSPAWWTRRSGNYSIEVRVNQGHWRQGIGTLLFELLRSRLIARRATRLLAWTQEDSESGRGFASRHGFLDAGQVLEDYVLCTAEANTAGYEGLEEDLKDAGVRIASLAEIGTEDEEFLRALQRLWSSFGDELTGEEGPDDSFALWQHHVLHAPGLSPETHWVALDGERPVGTTFLKRLSENAAENDFTGVAPTHRGRGIAPALKLHAIDWAREHGVDWFYTDSQIGNAPMIGINLRLGYKPGVRRLEIALDLG
jgi:GNAT superfamily N-acetyltransferase